MKNPVDISSLPPGTLTIHDAARLANVDRRVIQSALKTGELESVTFIRRVASTAIPVEALELWINRRAAKAVAR